MSKLKLPTKFKTGARVYSVQEVHDLFSEVGAPGDINHWKKLIRVDKKCSKENTFMHECVHAVERFLHVEVSDSMVERISHAALMVLADNAKYFRRLLDYLENQ